MKPKLTRFCSFEIIVSKLWERKTKTGLPYLLEKYFSEKNKSPIPLYRYFIFKYQLLTSKLRKAKPALCRQHVIPGGHY